MPTIENILIIDDNPHIRSDLCEIFILEGYTVYSAGDGEEGLQKLAENHTDLIICDYNMPKLDGAGVLREVRMSEKTAKLPFIMISGTEPPESTAQYDFIFMAKPIHLDTLLRTVRDF
ncbi:MAG: response regulator [Anaerolineae bacterium]|nr:response regulator [Anaerolineae bacterium]